MGTGFTIDAPLHVAKYGISTVISLVDDVLIEEMRKFHSEKAGEPYEAITNKDEDARACRITAYLNLLDRQIESQVRDLQASPFEKDSEITRYFELLPDTPLKRDYQDMHATEDEAEKTRKQDALRPRAVPGTIDVNIMTKLDSHRYRNGQEVPHGFTDALSAFRGFARSDTRSSIVYSAGMNSALYSYTSQFEDFYPDENGAFKKKIILKVSDYRSALVQGKFFAKRGLWISEYRVESGLNCGGHAFAGKGNLLGPVLDEFRTNRTQLIEMLLALYNRALIAKGRKPLDSPAEVALTVQGGIGTAGEHDFCLNHFKVDSTGWATPFLLVPEVTGVDDAHLKKLSDATEEEVFLSESSSLGIPFWNLRNSASEEARRRRIRDGKPGSACPKSYTKINTEFTEQPICISSRAFQKRKLEQISQSDYSEEKREALEKSTLAKSCICHDLGGAATIKLGINKKATPAICPGPNIANFSKIATLEEMVGHIYGRLSLLTSTNRPHMFIKELMINIDHLRTEVDNFSKDLSTKTPKYFREFKENLLQGIEHYQDLAEQFIEDHKTRFLSELKALQEELEQISLLNPA